MEWTSFEKYLCSDTRTIVDGKSLDVKNISLDVILAGPHPVNLLCKLAPLSDLSADLFKGEFGPPHDVILQRFAQFDKVSTVACYSYQQVFILIRICESALHGFPAYDIELAMHPFSVEIDIEK
jgi:hypothetical protein